MKPLFNIACLLLLAGLLLAGPGTGAPGKFVPDDRVRQLAQEYDRIYFPLFMQSLEFLRNNDLVCHHDPEFKTAWPSKVLYIKKKGRGILINTYIRLYSSKEKLSKSDRAEMEADLLCRKLEQLEPAELLHAPVPEKWRPARK